MTSQLPKAPCLACAQESGEGENDVFPYGVAAMQGWRTDMVGEGPPLGRQLPPQS